MASVTDAEFCKYIGAREKRISLTEARKVWLQGPGKHLKLIGFDSYYWAVDLDAWRLILDRSHVDAGTYRTDRYDCDDFAFAFKAECARRFGLNGVALICDYSASHAYNALMVLEGGSLKFMFAEPQNDKVIVGHEAERGNYMALNGFAIL